MRLIWQIINLSTLGVAKAQRRHEKSFTTSTRRGVCPTIFFNSLRILLRAIYKKVITSSTTLTRLRHSWINLLLWILVKNENVVMTLLHSLPLAYKHLIIVLETMSMTKIIMEYVTTCLMHEMSRRKERNTQGDHVIIMLR